MPLAILIAGERFPVLNGLSALTQNVLGTDLMIEFAQSYPELTRKMSNKLYDILISDIIMEGMDSFAMIENAIRINADIRILIVSMNPSIIFAPRYFQAGVFGYICTLDSEDEFRKAIWQMYIGKRYIPDTVIELLQDTNKTKTPNNPFAQLSKQEFSVLMILLEGKGTKEISTILNIRISTASTYRNRIFRKLKVDNLLELANLARHFGINAINIDSKIH